MTTSLIIAPDAQLMRQYLEPMIAATFSSRTPIRAIHWGRFDLATSYDTHVATVQFATGDTSKVFVKDFGFSVRRKDDAKQRREREVRVYQELLVEAGLGTAKCYGAIRDDERGQLWLLLEFVEGEPVGYCHLDSWTPAAAVLGRLHGYFARRIDELNACDFLIKHTSDFFWTKAEDGLRGVAQIAPHLNERLQNLVRRYRPVVDALASQPTTLVHGGCRPTNILINVASDPSRVCVVDWEEAGVGGPCFDLAYLLDGVQPPTLDRLLDAYDRAARDYGLAFSRGEMKYLIDCCRLHMIMNYFSRAALRGYDEQAIAKLIGVGEQIGQLVFHRRG